MLFCGKERQTKNWKEGHKHHCAMLGRLREHLEMSPQAFSTPMSEFELTRFTAALQLALMLLNKRQLNIPETHPGRDGKTPEEVFAAMKVSDYHRKQFGSWKQDFDPLVVPVALKITLSEAAKFAAEFGEIVLKMLYFSYTMNFGAGAGMYVEIPSVLERCDVNVGPVWLNRGTA
ncbi:hypothetical protein RvY_05868 [Ramazzottius varieornatus]|uniref:Uncharacterized protein n=1 Tax=Ramazzottius varieornatus TaxID=947166 RepID=A0A1D1UZI4_RAMVA|nr:hypothetical protein RvY_05868 [Ramazzottius varieornatus]